MDKEYDVRFQGIFTMQICGATSSGKSVFTKKLIENADVMINPPPDKILYCYGEWQTMFSEMSNVEFFRGINEDIIKRENLTGHTLLILDDLADEIDSKLLERIFTKISHHRSLSVILLIHSLFYPGLKNMRLISLNTHYLVIFKTARDQNSIATIARQMFGKRYKYMIDAYNDATSENYGYLIVDSKSSTPDLIRLRTKVFPGETTVAYIQQNGKI